MEPEKNQKRKGHVSGEPEARRCYLNTPETGWRRPGTMGPPHITHPGDGPSESTKTRWWGWRGVGGCLAPARLCRPLVGWLGWNQPISVQAGNHLKQRSLSLIKDDKIVFLLYITRMVKI